MRSVRFVKHWRAYNPDELAGFADDEAARLIAAGHAVDATPEPEPEPKAARRSGRAKEAEQATTEQANDADGPDAS